jgi:hypothetical protein
MNKLLNELRLDAGIARLDDNLRLVVLNKEGTVMDPLHGLEIFARLVIQECIKILEEAEEDIVNGDIFRDRQLWKRFEKNMLTEGIRYSIEKIEERFTE